MRAQGILAFALFLAVSASAQEPKSPTQAECSFSDASKITVIRSSDLKNFRFVTDGSLLAVKGIRVPAGDYAASPAKDSSNNWTLMMKKTIVKKGLGVVPPLPMSVATSSLTSEFPVYFDHTGGSCMMYWSEKKTDVVLTLEFTKENADQPVDN